MSKVAIVTDSISAIPQQMAQEYDIKVIPLYVVMDGKDYIETEVDRAEIYTRIRERDKSLTTSSISPGICLKTWQELSQKAESILCIALTPSMGMCYNSAIQAKGMARKEIPQTSIEVINSQTASGAQLLLVLAAAKAAAQSKSLPEVNEVVNSLIPRLSFISLAPTSQLIKDIGKNGKPHATINYFGSSNEAEELKKRLLAQFHCAELYVTEDSLIPPIHAGLGEIKIVVQRGIRKESSSLSLKGQTRALIARGMNRIYLEYVTAANPIIGIHTGPDILMVNLLSE